MVEKKLTAQEVFGDDEFPMFKTEKERIKYMSNAYRNCSLTTAFASFYGLTITPEQKKNQSINNIQQIELGQILSGTVKEFTKSTLTFDVPGIKEEIICKENFVNCMESIQGYLLTHNNKLLFEVREKKNNKYYVSVTSAYYKSWVDMINKVIQKEDGIQVHIDALVQGGYICHTDIVTLNNLTGRHYTHSVFIPGSHIVLNIEHDFEKWIGQDVIIVPQKFVEFKKNFKTGETENSLVGSRKRVLEIFGSNNLAEMYHTYLLSKKDNVKYIPETYDGTVTGIINSQKKTGIFVEINDKYITGLANIDAVDLLDYKPGDTVRVRIKEFEVQEGKEPFVYNKRGKIIKCNTRLVLELA